ncbi:MULTISPECIES: hypothetical protein [unclassified Bacteroides]|jgi:hypothetical protein|uniref:hypothetical protein n=1 Tax=unclassified Bacteroides TaxID=2646097 RepID=UPI000E989DF2|nr:MULTISPECIES: hypothetical protein [unclassified Bacteroides]RGN48165.1 hypothetical protein DXB63_08555 [Bacteroides sp. OM05-12]RHR76173.1 hypothetical protein DWW69_08430 [Bacteroides sp. AF16-49]
MENERKITVMGVIQEGIGVGLKNSLSLLGAIVLWILTIWIPYINVGTTIAIYTIPVALSKGKVISPTFIFDAKYRQYMGEFFTIIGLMMMSIFPAMLFMVIPAYVIAIGWSLAIYIMLDKGIAPGECLVRSNKATYGYKWTIFFISLVLCIIYYILIFLFALIPIIGIIVNIALSLAYVAINLGCSAVIYKKLTVEASDKETIVPEPEATITATEE